MNAVSRAFLFAGVLSACSPTKPSVPEVQHASRIVTLMPSLGELVVAIDGHDQRLVGVSEFTDYPEALKKKPSIGPYPNVNLEQIRSLKPDLILGSKDGNHPDQISRLGDWGYRVGIVNPATLAEIAEMIPKVADMMGAHEKGLKLRAEFDRGKSAAEKRAKARVDLRPRQRILMQVGDDPLIIVGGKNYLSEVIELVGAENVYADSGTSYPRISREDVLQKNPDQILILALHGSESEFLKMQERWGRFKALRAVKDHQVKIIRADALLRPGVRLPSGWEALERAVYP